MAKTELEEKHNGIQYVVYNNNGDILRTGICPVRDLEHQKGPGEHVMKQENQNDIIRDNTHKIKSGKIVKKSENDKKI